MLRQFEEGAQHLQYGAAEALRLLAADREDLSITQLDVVIDLEAALKKLTRKDLKASLIVQMYHTDDLTQEEIALDFETSQVTVSRIIKSATDFLNRIMNTA